MSINKVQIQGSDYHGHSMGFHKDQNTNNPMNITSDNG